MALLGACDSAIAQNSPAASPVPADILKVVLRAIPPRGGYVPMPSFVGILSDQQIADVANYVRTSWGNDAPPNVTAQMVANMRRTVPGAGR